MSSKGSVAGRSPTLKSQGSKRKEEETVIKIKLDLDKSGQIQEVFKTQSTGFKDE